MLGLEAGAVILHNHSIFIYTTIPIPTPYQLPIQIDVEDMSRQLMM